MYKFLILLKKEFLQIFRDKFIWRSVLLLPVVQLLVLPLAADNEIRDFRMAAIDRDNTQFSRLMLADLQAGGYFTLSASAAAWVSPPSSRSADTFSRREKVSKKSFRALC